jgi:hypothetical protein
MLYSVIFFILAVFTAVLFLVNIKVVLEYKRNDEDDNITIFLYTLKGMFKYKYEVPLVDFGQTGIKFRLVKEKGKKDKKISEKKGRLKIAEILDKYILVKVNYEANKDLICDIKKYLKTRLFLNKFRLNICEGTGNACYTGIICGILWSLTGMLTSGMSNLFKTYEKCVSIRPDFNLKVFNVDLCCIFHIKLVHIIVVLIKIFSNRFKEKYKIKKEIGGDLSG